MKQNRHQKIAELVSRYEIETQEELAEKLKEAGFTVTQATISRDIRQMNLSKLPTGNGRQKYVILKKENELLSDKYIRVLRDGFVSMDMAQNILVMRTVSGMAMAVAAALDASPEGAGPFRRRGEKETRFFQTEKGTDRIGLSLCCTLIQPITLR